ncbi:MAG: hypothetical protein KJ674_02835 [Nanoarchaeota archaeon]|nr:hypothetical protein [Nanoarchaeota archaeon]
MQYSEERMREVLAESLSRLSTIGISERRLNAQLQLKAEEWNSTHEVSDSFTPIEYLVIGHDLFQECILQFTGNLLRCLERNGNITNTRAINLINKFEQIAFEVYQFNTKTLPKEYHIDFEDPWKRYKSITTC